MTKQSPGEPFASHGVKSSLHEPGRCHHFDLMRKAAALFLGLLSAVNSPQAPTDSPWQCHSCFLACQNRFDSQGSLHSFKSGLEAIANGRWFSWSVFHLDCRTVYLPNVECFDNRVPFETPWGGWPTGSSLLLSFYCAELKNKLLGLHQGNQPWSLQHTCMHVRVCTHSHPPTHTEQYSEIQYGRQGVFHCCTTREQLCRFWVHSHYVSDAANL